MEQNIYNGSSDGFSAVCKGYLDYAENVIAARAFVDLRDGLKPVQRRSLYATEKMNLKHLEKCVTIVGKILHYHPHGDGSVWNAFCLMSDKNGTMNMPLVKGKGNLGYAFSSAAPAAMRYPEAMLHPNANDYFKDKEVIDYIESETGNDIEPEVLPVCYPSVLVNGTSGIGVSVSALVPSFNFGDVIDMTLKYLENKELDVSDILVPDFATGGILVRNDEELAKIMKTGRGKLKVRARVEIDGKSIRVMEVPYGKTVQGIIKLINRAEIKEIIDADEVTGRDYKTTGHIKITCRSKRVTEYVLMELYRRNILQSTVASNIIVVESGTPLIIGVHEIIERWCDWRRKKVHKKCVLFLESFKKEMETLSYFIRLINNGEWRDNYVDRVIHSSKASASEYLHEIFPDIPEDVCDWIYGRRASSFNNGGKHVNRLNELESLKSEYEGYLVDVDSYIKKELEELKLEKAGSYERKTEVTYQDYKFSKLSDSPVEDTSYCVYTLTRDGFLKKSREVLEGDDVLCSIQAQANSILVGFDNYGRVLRVVGSEIPFTAYNGTGIYMPKYFDASFQEDYRVLYLGLLDGSRRMLVYSDGYIGFLDTSEWVGKKVMKVVSHGVDTMVYDKLVEVIEENEIPEYLMVGEEKDDVVRFGITRTSDIPVRSRRSRAKVFYGNNTDIAYLAGFTYGGLMQYIENPNRYYNKFKPLKGELYGDPALMLAGRYTL